MADAEVTIKTDLLDNGVVCRFLTDRPLHDQGVFFSSKEATKGSPLAAKLFEFEEVVAVKIAPEGVTLHRASTDGWDGVEKKACAEIQAAARSGKPAVAAGTPANLPTADAIRKKAQEIIDSRISPALAGHGGSISLENVKGATVYVRLGGGCSGCGMARMTLRHGVERALRDEIPELDEVVDLSLQGAGGSSCC